MVSSIAFSLVSCLQLAFSRRSFSCRSRRLSSTGNRDDISRFLLADSLSIIELIWLEFSFWIFLSSLSLFISKITDSFRVIFLLDLWFLNVVLIFTRISSSLVLVSIFSDNEMFMRLVSRVWFAIICSNMALASLLRLLMLWRRGSASCRIGFAVPCVAPAPDTCSWICDCSCCSCFLRSDDQRNSDIN